MKQFVMHGVVHDSDNGVLVHVASEHDSPNRDSPNEIRCAVDRVDDPSVGSRPFNLRMLFPDNAVVRKSPCNLLPDEQFDIPVRLRNKILRSFDFNRKRIDIPKIVQRPSARLPANRYSGFAS